MGLKPLYAISIPVFSQLKLTAIDVAIFVFSQLKLTAIDVAVFVNPG
jgi:hypothetical protein